MVGRSRAVDIQALAACKWHFSALPVLMYLKVHSAPVLEKHHFRHAITRISTTLVRPIVTNSASPQGVNS
ncbi:hypothetical protein DEA98_03910 [Brucella pseudogrignonensis]|uniref:Uncharacterized protein n=1 Tax=Brucella pseudogrignonensis TaxID=419475 RepID=A0A7Y3WXB3_9HYPH|nr:hypothetical protein [Brucella pseudogrignonensis]NNV21177.1 hypothetical protein [Brucella pseudogrignonensis]